RCSAFGSSQFMEPAGPMWINKRRIQRRGEFMKFVSTAIALAAFATLTACGGNPAAENVEEAAENQAENIEAQADNLEAAADETTGATENALENQADALHNQAEAVEEAGENKADAIEANSH